jgi:MFS transporter, NNP family, nitrate/nitrite transporter
VQIASLFGWMNLFARGLGGYVSDLANQKWGMPGRLWAQTICLAIEGAFVLIFANTKSLAGAILVMVLFSTFVQAAEGVYV